MSTPRELIVQALKAAAPATVSVVAYGDTASPQKRSQALVRIDEVAPEPTAPQAMWVFTYGVVLIASKTHPGPADDELDKALVDVLHAIEKADGHTWTRAVRATFEETKIPAYEITVQVHITK